MSTKGVLMVLLCMLLMAVGWPIVAGCDRGSEEQQAIQPLPATAEILFTSNRDTGTSRKEIYAMDAQGGDVTRITFTNENHFVVGIDASNRYVAATRGQRTRSVCGCLICRPAKRRLSPMQRTMPKDAASPRRGMDRLLDDPLRGNPGRHLQDQAGWIRANKPHQLTGGHRVRPCMVVGWHPDCLRIQHRFPQSLHPEDHEC